MSAPDDSQPDHGVGAGSGSPMPGPPEPDESEEPGCSEETEVSDVPIGVPVSDEEFRAMKEAARRMDDEAAD